MTDTNAAPNAVAEAYGIEWKTAPTVDAVRACALGNAVDHHRRRIGEVPDPDAVLATARRFEDYLRGGESDAP